jgi:hypothetical protein
MCWLAAFETTKFVNQALAPFVAIGTITSICTAVAALFAKAEALNAGWDREAHDAYIASMINEGIACGAALAFWPVAYLIGDAVA